MWYLESQSTKVQYCCTSILPTVRWNSPQGLVRLRTQVQVEPTQLLVITSDDQVVPARVNVHARDPLETRHERLEELLAHQVVQADVSLGLSAREVGTISIK